MTKLIGKHPKKAKLAKPKILIFGEAGAGKTFGTLDFPSVYFVDAEAGATLPHYTDKLTASGAAYVGVEDGANDFPTLLREVKTLSVEKHQFKTLVIDSFSKLFKTCKQQEHDRLSAKAAAKGKELGSTYGAESKPAIAYTRRLLLAFQSLDMNVILVCHEKALWQDDEQVGMTFDAWPDLAYELDLVLRIAKEGRSRKARIVKSRLKAFEEAGSFNWGFDAFADLYGRDALVAESEPVPVASQDQVDEIELLADNIDFDITVRQTWFDAAGVRAWSEMDASTLAKCIDHLKLLQPTQ